MLILLKEFSPNFLTIISSDSLSIPLIYYNFFNYKQISCVLATILQPDSQIETVWPDLDKSAVYIIL